MTIPVTPTEDIPKESVPTPMMESLLFKIFAEYEPSIFEDDVERPEMLIISKFLNL